MIQTYEIKTGGDAKPRKTYNELLEIKVRKLVSKYVEGDSEDLVFEILELMEKKK